MTDINAIIQAVLDTGELGLPECVSTIKLDDGPLLTCRAVVVDNTEPWRLQEALDKIAMHWARNRPTLDAGQPHGVRFVMALMRGDSEAAIAAIHAALCGEESDDA